MVHYVDSRALVVLRQVGTAEACPSLSSDPSHTSPSRCHSVSRGMAQLLEMGTLGQNIEETDQL